MKPVNIMRVKCSRSAGVNSLMKVFLLVAIIFFYFPYQPLCSSAVLYSLSEWWLLNQFTVIALLLCKQCYAFIFSHILVMDSVGGLDCPEPWWVKRRVSSLDKVS